VSKKTLKTVLGAAIGVALCVSSTVASAAVAPAQSFAPMSISPFVALSAYGTMQSRSAVCATEVGATGAAVEGAAAAECVLPVADPAASVAPAADSSVATPGVSFGIGALLAGLVAVAGLAAVFLSSNDKDDRLPISPD